MGLRIFGTLGDLYLESKDKGVIELYFKDGRTEHRTFAPANGYYYELLNFYNAFQSNEPIVSTPEKESGDIRLIFDILQSVKTNRCVTCS